MNSTNSTVSEFEITSIEYILNFVIGLFYLYLLPLMITIVFMILISDWFQGWWKNQIPDNWVRYVTSILIFLAFTFIITRTYIVEVLENEKSRAQ